MKNLDSSQDSDSTHLYNVTHLSLRFLSASRTLTLSSLAEVRLAASEAAGGGAIIDAVDDADPRDRRGTYSEPAVRGRSRRGGL